MELVLYLFCLKCSKRFVIFSSPTPTLIPFAEGNNALRHSPQPANNMEVSKGYLILCFKIMVFLKLEQALAVWMKRSLFSTESFFFSGTKMI